MTNQPFDSKAVQVGIVCALVAFPFALGIGAFAAKLEFIKTLFFGSDWFAFKAVVGVVEIVVFGLGAAVSQSRRSGHRH